MLRLLLELVVAKTVLWLAAPVYSSTHCLLQCRTVHGMTGSSCIVVPYCRIQHVLLQCHSLAFVCKQSLYGTGITWMGLPCVLSGHSRIGLLSQCVGWLAPWASVHCEENGTHLSYEVGLLLSHVTSMHHDCRCL